MKLDYIKTQLFSINAKKKNFSYKIYLSKNLKENLIFSTLLLKLFN